MNTAVYEQFYTLEGDHWWFAGMREICRTVLKRPMRGSSSGEMRCLDVGCGTGLWTKELETFGQVCGLDVAPEALRFCQKRGMHRLVHATAEHLPFVPESYELITAIGVIEHLNDEKGFLSELYRVCKPGGYVLLLTSAYGFLWSRHDDVVHHKRRYMRGQFGKLLTSSGFEVIRGSYVNTLLFPPILAVRLVQRLRAAPTMTEHGSPDVFKSASLLNKLLYALLWAEAKLLNFVSFPFGVGLLAVVRKPAS